MHDVPPDPVRAALLGPHRSLLQRHGTALRYPPEICPFVATPTDERGWSDLAALVGDGGLAVVTGPVPLPLPDWPVEARHPGVQLIGDDVHGGPDPEAVELGDDDVDAMLALVARTRPGPFLRRTHVLGTYLGLRENGRLIAMAGERLRPTGYSEISAVCTDPDHQGRGLATRLTFAMAARIRERGEVPFLHTTADNSRAISLYGHLGFRNRGRRDFVALRVPG